MQQRHGFAERGLTGQLWLDNLPQPSRAVPAPAPGRLVTGPLVPAKQMVLPFGVLARDWTRLHPRTLPGLAELAPGLDEDLRSKAVDQSWPSGAYKAARRLLAVVVMYGTPEQPFTMAELNTLCQRVIRPQIGAHRVVDLLVRNGIVTIEPTACRDERWVGRHVAALPDNVRDDVEAWIRALRGRGKRPSPPVA